MLQNVANIIPSGFELIIIVVVIAGILLFGAKKIPEIAKTLGRSRTEYEKGKFEAEKEFKDLKEKKD
jgi:sec-independent protein translocase protein TatA